MTHVREGGPSQRRTVTSRLRLVEVGLVGLLSLTACATPSGTASPSSSPSDSTVSPTPSPSATLSETSPAPAPTETSAVDTPYNGQVLVVTAERQGDQLQVTAMIPGVSESDGICTLELLDGGGSVSLAGTAGNDVTYCGLMSVTPAGDGSDWRFRVRYESSATRAESAISMVEPTS